MYVDDIFLKRIYSAIINNNYTVAMNKMYVALLQLSTYQNEKNGHMFWKR